MYLVFQNSKPLNYNLGRLESGSSSGKTEIGGCALCPPEFLGQRQIVISSVNQPIPETQQNREVGGETKDLLFVASSFFALTRLDQAFILHLRLPFLPTLYWFWKEICLIDHLVFVEPFATGKRRNYLSSFLKK